MTKYNDLEYNDLVLVITILLAAMMFAFGSYSASFQTFNHILFSVVFFVLGLGFLIAMGSILWKERR
jgi:predicted Na+-dependent transporter